MWTVVIQMCPVCLNSHIAWADVENAKQRIPPMYVLMMMIMITCIIKLLEKYVSSCSFVLCGLKLCLLNFVPHHLHEVENVALEDCIRKDTAKCVPPCCFEVQHIVGRDWWHWFYGTLSVKKTCTFVCDRIKCSICLSSVTV